MSRIAIVTGATSGIGEAATRAFIANGYAVVGNGRNAARLEELAAELGDRFHPCPGDASDPDILEKLMDSAPQAFGAPADIVLANAGRGLGGAVREVEFEDFQDVFRINVSGTFALLQKAARSMVELQAGRFPGQAADIVIIGSVVGRHISPFSAAYGASKFAVHALAEALRREVGPAGVRVSLVAPGFVISGFQAVAGYSDDMVQGFKDKYGPLLSPEDVARSILFMVSQPPHVHVGDLIMRPTRQDYP